MQTLFPPDYPDRPDAPLLAFGPSFAEEISRSLIAAMCRPFDEQPHEEVPTVAAGLTMLEAFHPRDQLECMLATQGVAAHAATMDSFRLAMLADTPLAMAIKLRSSATQTMRACLLVVHELDRRQAKPLPPRPPEPVSPEAKDPPPPADAAPERDELAEDMKVRPDGTPGSLAAYAPKAPDVPFVPREAAINIALATRPKPWRQVNGVPEQPREEPVLPEPARRPVRGPLDLHEKFLTGDALSRFASARFDPDAPPPEFDDEDGEVDIEIVSTGGDPDAEADRAAIMAAHPEGKPIVTYRYGPKAVPKEPTDKG